MKNVLCIHIFVLALILAAASGTALSAEDGFIDLFNGKNLDGWEQHGGVAKYTVEDGVIVGTSVPNTSNSFLCTKKHYSDFILELEFKVDPSLNSGIQVRSHVYDHPTVVKVKKEDGSEREIKIPAGRVHGYQIEIDPSDRAWSAGIYDEGRRGWLNDLAGDENIKAREAFKQGEWNHVRVEAIGDSIKTWLNGVPAADLKDDMSLSGFIALQVHGVGNNLERVGKQVSWRNIKLKVVSSQ